MATRGSSGGKAEERDRRENGGKRFLQKSTPSAKRGKNLRNSLIWREMGRAGFEPAKAKPTDLQA